MQRKDESDVWDFLIDPNVRHKNHHLSLLKHLQAINQSLDTIILEWESKLFIQQKNLLNLHQIKKRVQHSTKNNIWSIFRECFNLEDGQKHTANCLEVWKNYYRWNLFRHCLGTLAWKQQHFCTTLNNKQRKRTEAWLPIRIFWIPMTLRRWWWLKKSQKL